MCHRDSFSDVRAQFRSVPTNSSGLRQLRKAICFSLKTCFMGGKSSVKFIFFFFICENNILRRVRVQSGQMSPSELTASKTRTQGWSSCTWSAAQERSRLRFRHLDLNRAKTEKTAAMGKCGAANLAPDGLFNTSRRRPVLQRSYRWILLPFWTQLIFMIIKRASPCLN